MPPEAIAVPRPVTEPVPALFAKVTTVELSEVSRLSASRISTVSVFSAPEATLEVSLVEVKRSFAAVPAVTLKESSLSL